MGKIDQTVAVSDITNIITQEMALMEVNSCSQFSSTTSTFQSINNSSDCKNIKITKETMQYVSYNTVFQSVTAVQSLYANIMNAISASFDSDQTGASIGKIDQSLLATINNLVQTTLTQKSIVDFYNNINVSDTSVQICTGSSNGLNFIFGTSDEVYEYYQQSYTQMTQIQKVSADIANTLDSDMSAKQTGIIAMITRMITVICVVLIIIAAIVVVVVLFGMVG